MESFRLKWRSQSSFLGSALPVGEQLSGGWREKEEAASEANTEIVRDWPGRAARAGATYSRLRQVALCASPAQPRPPPIPLPPTSCPTRVSVPRSSGKLSNNGVSVRIRACPARAVVHFSQHHRAGRTGSAARAEGSETTPAIRQALYCAQSTFDGRMGAISPDPPWHGGTGRYRHTTSLS